MKVGTDNSGCINRQWYRDLTNPNIACTNSYPSSWNDPSIHEAVMFDSSDACCHALVDLLGGSYGECSMIDDCRAFTMAATTQRRLSCANSIGFHPNTQTEEGCTNDLNYPEAWLRNGLKEKMFFPTAQGCCDFFFRGDKCPIVDICPAGGSPPTPPTKPTPQSPTPASPPSDPACLWHVDITLQDGCSNDSNYPAEWMNSAVKANMLHPTAAVCCTKMFPNGRACKHHNRGCDAAPKDTPPSPTPASAPATPGCLWHMELNLQDGCTNDSKYPPEWLDAAVKNRMMHSSASVCCTKMFPNKPSCNHYDRGCDGSVPKAPGPTKGPTRQPIKNPTRRPTPRPTSDPTKKPIEFYVVETSGICVSDEDIPKPHWIERTFSDYNSCCFVARNSELCFKTRPSKDGGPPLPGPTLPPGPPKPWYVQESSGLCVSGSEKPKPNWIEETFSHYDLCCENARDVALCRKARPSSVDGRPLGTLRPTPTPPAMFYADQNTGTCVSDAEKPKPSYITSTFEDFNRCCILDTSDPEKCMSVGPSLDVESYVPTPVPPAIFYVQESSGLCVNENDVPMPYLIAKTFKGYDECCESGWNEDTCLAQRPTMVPTTFPTWSPSTPWPTETAFCPEAYESSGTIYKQGSEVEVNLVAYRCKPPPYSAYCNQSAFQPPQEDPGVTAPPKTNSNIPVTNTNGNGVDQLWQEAWERLFICVFPPSASPSMAPSTPTPTCDKTRWHPGEFRKKICTNSASYPVIWNDPTLSQNYFVDTADECCSKFYPRSKKCRIRDVCS